MDNLNIINKYLENALLSLDEQLSEEIITAEVEQKSISAAGILISDTLKHIGKSWEIGKLSLSQIYMSGVIAEKIIDKLLLPASPVWHNQPKAAIAVFEDFHYLGKRIVCSSLRASGFNILDLGGGLNAEEIIQKVRDNDVRILLISTLMLPSALKMKDLIGKLKDDNVKIIVGGAPFNFDKELWKEIGADFYGSDSAEAIKIMQELMQE